MNNTCTTTQTGPDYLAHFKKDDAIKNLELLWKISPRWIPSEINWFNYPFISKDDYLSITGEKRSILDKYLPLLDIQKEKGFLSKEDINTESSYFKSNSIDIVGASLNNNDIYLLDPIAGNFMLLPNTKDGKKIYHEFYTARFHYIESIPTAFKFLGREKINIKNTEEASSAFSRTIVIICGLGTGGGETAIRLGKQLNGINLTLIDGGVFGPENIDRQVATPDCLGLNKSIAVGSKIFQINPMLKNITCIPSYITKENADNIFNYVLSRYTNDNKPIIQIIDEIDVTEEETLVAKAALHLSAIKLAKRLQIPVYVHWSLDIGASGEVVGTCRYLGNEQKIFQGDFSIKMARLPAILAMFKLVPKKAIGLEMIQDIKKRLAKDGKMEHISQTGLSAIGVAKIISTRVILTSLGFGQKLVNRSFHDDLRSSFNKKNRLLIALKRIPFTLLLFIYGGSNRYFALKKIKNYKI